MTRSSFSGSVRSGEVTERLKVPDLKSGAPERAPWVRIPPSPPATPATRLLPIEEELSRLPRDLLLYGGTALSYGLVGDPSVRAYRCEHGTIAYGKVWTPAGTRVIAASDPLAAPEKLSPLLESFLRAYPKAAFFQVSRTTADALAPFGYRRTYMGVETTVPLAEWSPAGHKQQCFRTALNRSKREGHEIVESRCEDVGVERLEVLSEAWMQGQAQWKREIRFFGRPAIYAHEPGVRKFFALKNGAPTAFVVFDPMFRQGRVFGYVAMTLRQHPAATPGLCDAVILHAALEFQKEGIEELQLGMSPFRPSRDPFETVGEPPWATMFVAANWSLLDGLFDHQGIAGHKRRWKGVEKPVYYAGAKGRSFFDFVAAARLTGLL